MKILHIRFKNINSLRGEHNIDFTDKPLKNAGLVAITGPTGSGKTTLLDVISLALYNKIPRLHEAITSKVIKETGVILSRNTTEAFAEVTYESIQGIYTSHWSISTARTGNLRDHYMEIAEYETGNILDLKKSKVPEENEKLIGLNYDQFIRSILLAQGEFSKFLKSKKDERGKLLERITGSEIYRLVGAKAYEKGKEITARVKVFEAEREVYEKDLLTDKEYNEEQLHYKQLEASLVEKKIAITYIQEQLKKLESKRKLEQNLKSINSSLALTESEFKQFETTHGLRLANYQKLIPFSGLFSNLISNEQNLIKLKQEEEKFVKLQQENTDEQEQLIAKLNVENARTFKWIEVEKELIGLTNQINEIDREQSICRTEFKGKLQEVQRNSQKLNLVIQSNTLSNGLDICLKLELDLNTRKKALSKLLPKELQADVISGIAVLKNEDELLQKSLLIEEKVCALNQQLEQLSIEKKELIEDAKHVPNKLEKLSLNKHLLAKEIELKKKEEELHRLKASLSEHRSRLKLGEPCPLCGAVEHPLVTDKSHTSTYNNSEVVLLEQKLIRLEKEHVQLAEKENWISKRVKQVERQENELNLNLKSKLAEQANLKNNIRWANEKDKLNEQRVGINKLINQLEEWKEVIEKIALTEELKPMIRDSIKLLNKGLSLKTRMDQFFKTVKGSEAKSFVEAHLDRWREVNVEQQKVNAQLNIVKKSKQETFDQNENTKQELQTKLTKLGFGSIEIAKSYMLEANEVELLTKKADMLKEKRVELKSKLLVVSSQLQEIKEEKIEEEHDLNRLLQENTSTIDLIEKDKEKVYALLRQQEKAQSMVEQLNYQIGAIEKGGKKWRLLKEYIGDSEGKKFSTFAQELTLLQLIELANRRLKQLNKRYLLSIPQENEDDSLSVIDLDMGGVRRSIKTLSGGETFLMSLSLALALSDLASKNVEIKSLFIDEGFGTLDPETLDLTLDTLERLQVESQKMIGVISHVEALKDRITTQVELIRNGQGNSTVQINT